MGRKKQDLVEIRKEELIKEYMLAETDQQKSAIILQWNELDDRSLEWEKIRAEHRLDAKTLFNGGLTLLLAGGTLIFECSDTLRSKVTNLWLRRVR